MKPFAWISRPIALLCIWVSGAVIAQDAGNTQKPEGPYQFTMSCQWDHTPVKNQYRTGTCWCFATVSFLESEAIRLKGVKTDLSEMFVVRRTYPLKAENFVRLHGAANFSEGGQAHDVLDQISRFGIVPEEVYPGLNYGEKKHDHGELVPLLKSMLDAVVKKGGRITPCWDDAFARVLDVYLGVPPENFLYQGSPRTPKSFAADVLGIRTGDYIELTSYTHYPFYTQCRLEIPDNWTYNDGYYNVSLDELEAAVDHALKNGHTVVWDGDVSERDFNTRETGYAIVPLRDREDMLQAERDKKPEGPVPEKDITQEMRQETLDNFTTTDDHLMHIVGIAQDQNGGTFYYIKNSGGTDGKFGGYLYMSRAYFRLKTTACMLHKDALMPELKKKLGL